MPVTEPVVRKVALSFPLANERPSYGKPSFFIAKKFFTRLRPEDESFVWIVGSIDERDNLIELDPKTYFITEHYRDYPCVLVRIKRINEAMLRKMLERRWRATAPKKLIRDFDCRKPELRKHVARGRKAR
jgi:hypothetical protein